MGTTQPIRDLSNIKKLKEFFLNKGEIRNYTMITIGLNTCLRISDILRLKWKDVYNFEMNQYYKHITITEMKTKKTNTVLLNQMVIQALELLKNEEKLTITPNTYIIKSRSGANSPISRTRAFEIIKNAAKKLNFEDADHISCHSLRKTFGYQAWKNGTPPALLMEIYNHSSIEITKRYLCINQDDKDEIFANINL